MRILLVKLSSLGDIIHVTPCIKALRKYAPDSSISMIVKSQFSAVVKYNPYLNHVMECESIFSISQLLMEKPFDLAIDFQGRLHSAICVYFSRAKVKSGRGSYRPFWQSKIIPVQNRHAVTICADVLKNLGIPVVDKNPEVFLSPLADQSLTKYLKTLKLDSMPFLLINPFSRVKSKEWPRERYQDLIRNIRKISSIPIVISGASYEIARSYKLLQGLEEPNVFSTVGKLSLEEALCLYKKASLLITGDTGPMHAAAAMRTPVISLFGPTLPDCTGPWGFENTVIQKLKPPTHYAYKKDPMKSHMRAIQVSDVFSMVRHSLRP